MPQLIEQWRLQSADGIAIGFISIWFLGDVLNLIGSIWAGLLPEVIFLAIWFCIADSLMIFSYIYYTRIFPKHHRRRSSHRKHSHNSSHEVHESSSGQENAPLLRRRSSTLTDIAMEQPYQNVFVSYVLPILFVLGAGTLGYFLSGSSSGPSEDDKPMTLGPQIVGYLSAFLYLGARIPQIIQNHRRRSVEGLSLLFFLLSTLGNITYAGQILFYRSDSQYILLNLSWLLGSIGTISEDIFIFLQFYMYKNSKHEAVAGDA
ncbi:putative vacuolar amino acid transporter YPQ3 [Meyerozyma sp. JA9]|nr:putative vacuolar amino acid transporter YPQ3 [Meyerozyma sp. JA9]